MPTETSLHLRCENFPDTDLIGSADPYFQVWFKDQILYQSEVAQIEDNAFQFEVATFEISRSALFREINLKIFDKDTFSSDDLMVEMEIRFPFQSKTYTIGDSGATVSVLNDSGEVDPDDESEGSVIDEEDGKEEGFFTVKNLGKIFIKKVIF